jgi:hypothetical protein
VEEIVTSWKEARFVVPLIRSHWLSSMTNINVMNRALILRLSKEEERHVVQAKSTPAETGRSSGKKRKRSPNLDINSSFRKAGPSRLRSPQPRGGDAATTDHGFEEEDLLDYDAMPTSDSREQEPDAGKHLPLCSL